MKSVTCWRVPPVGAVFTKKAMMTRATQLMNSTKPKKRWQPRAMPVRNGSTGKWMMMPDRMSMIMAIRLIQWVTTKIRGWASL